MPQFWEKFKKPVVSAAKTIGGWFKGLPSKVAGVFDTQATMKPIEMIPKEPAITTEPIRPATFGEMFKPITEPFKPLAESVIAKPTMADFFKPKEIPKKPELPTEFPKTERLVSTLKEIARTFPREGAGAVMEVIERVSGISKKRNEALNPPSWFKKKIETELKSSLSPETLNKEWVSYYSKNIVPAQFKKQEETKEQSSLSPKEIVNRWIDYTMRLSITPGAGEILSKEKYPGGPEVEKFIFGEKPVESLTKQGEETLKGFGVPKNQAKQFGLTTGIVFLGLDLLPVGGDDMIKLLVKANKVDDVKKILFGLKGIDNAKITDNVVEAIAKSVDPKEIKGIVEGLSAVEPRAAAKIPEAISKISEPAKEAVIPHKAEVQKELVDITPIETVPEYAIDKEIKQQRLVKEKSRKVADLVEKINPNTEESKALFNAFENPEKYPLSETLATKGGKELLEEQKVLNEFLTEEKLKRELMERAINDDTYLKTILENADGTPASAERLARLKNAMDEPFKEQLIYRQPIGKIVKEPRKYATADARDEVLKSFGLRTKRDFVASVKANIDLTAKLTARKDFEVALRRAAKESGRADITEVYNPADIKKFVSEQRQTFVRLKDKMLETLRSNKAITNEELRIIKDKAYLGLKEEKEFARTFVDIDDLTVSKTAITDEIKTAFKNLEDETKIAIARAREGIRGFKQSLSIEARTEIEVARTAMEKNINDFYGKIVSERGKLIDAGMKDLGEIMISGQPLRGIMVNKKDFAAVQEILKQVKPSNLEDAARTLKLLQATLDLFQIPQALRGAIRLEGLKGISRWWEALRGVGMKKLDIKDVVEASEFTRLGRHVDFDIEIWDKFQRTLGETSGLTRLLEKIQQKLPSSIRKSIIEPVKKLENYQWDTLMVPLKVDVWKDLVSKYQKLYPNLSLREIKVRAGRAVDDYFGGQNYQRLMARNPKLISQSIQRASNIFIFARDYLLTSLRQLSRETKGVFAKGMEGDLNRKALVRKIIYGLGTSNVISYIINGHSTFENDDPNQWYKIQVPGMKDTKGNPYYLDLMGNWGQTWNLINRPVNYFGGKIGGLGQVGLSGLSGQGLEFEGLNPIPFSWRNIVESTLFQLTGKKEFGVASDIETGALITGLEFVGLSGTFSAGKGQTATIAKMIKEGKITPINFWNWLIGRPMAKEEKKENKLDYLFKSESSGVKTMEDLFQQKATGNKLDYLFE